MNKQEQIYRYLCYDKTLLEIIQRSFTQCIFLLAGTLEFLPSIVVLPPGWTLAWSLAGQYSANEMGTRYPGVNQRSDN